MVLDLFLGYWFMHFCAQNSESGKEKRILFICFNSAIEGDFQIEIILIKKQSARPEEENF